MRLTLGYVKDIVTIITLVIGSYVALRGLQTWKSQLKGSQDYNLAKSLLLSLYKYKEALFQLRNPAVWTYEYPKFTNEELDEMHHDERNYRNIVYAYQKRWERVIQIKPALHEMIFESQVLWENTIKELFEKLFKLEYELQDALTNHIENKNPNKRSQMVPDYDLVFDKLNEDDGFRKRVNPIINEIQSLLKEKIKRIK